MVAGTPMKAEDPRGTGKPPPNTHPSERLLTAYAKILMTKFYDSELTFANASMSSQQRCTCVQQIGKNPNPKRLGSCLPLDGPAGKFKRHPITNL